jgi:RHS repeat-associated protein
LGNGQAGATVTAAAVFTGKERDAETGLDYFGARYFSAAQGRFTSPDEFAGGIVDPFTGQQVDQPGPLPYADISDPQTLNKYVYVRNSPLRYVDPDGHDFRDWLQAGVEFVGGIGQGVAASSSWGAVGAPSPSDSLASRFGQAVGTGLAGFAGTEAAGAGTIGGILTSPTGIGAVAGGAVAVAGATTALGAAKNIGALVTAPMQQSKVEGIAGQIAQGGYKVKSNPKTGTQEGNVTITHPSDPSRKLNVRVETGPVPGSNKAVRHANVQVVKTSASGNKRTVRNVHITEEPQ